MLTIQKFSRLHQDFIKEIFNVIGKYERRTGAKIIVEKRRGYGYEAGNKELINLSILIGKIVKLNVLSIWIGNEDATNENFIEQQSKIKNKLNFWKRVRLLLIGRIKVLNTFIFSRLWYRTEFRNIPNDIERSIHQVILDFI